MQDTLLLPVGSAAHMRAKGASAQRAHCTQLRGAGAGAGKHTAIWQTYNTLMSRAYVANSSGCMPKTSCTLLHLASFEVADTQGPGHICDGMFQMIQYTVLTATA